jgi:hypothetical protein
LAAIIEPETLPNQNFVPETLAFIARLAVPGSGKIHDLAETKIKGCPRG